MSETCDFCTKETDKLYDYFEWKLCYTCKEEVKRNDQINAEEESRSDDIIRGEL